MEIRAVDVMDDEDVLRFWQASKESDEFQRPFAAFWSLRSATVALREIDTTLERRPLLALEKGEVLATAQLALPLLENLHVGYVGVRVRPAHRRKGVGTRVFDDLMRRFHEAGRTTALAEVDVPLPDPKGGAAPFLERWGFKAASVDIHRVLDLPVTKDHLDALEQVTVSHADGYRLVTCEDVVPDEYVEGFCLVQEAFNSEAPMGDIELEPEKYDEKRVRQDEERFRKQGRHKCVTMALAPTGDVVGLTELFTSDSQPSVSWQSGTLVLRGHRGHRLGMATKVANLRRLQASFPQVRMVHSWNAEENGPMISINEALGFRPVEYLVEMQAEFAPPP